LIIEYFAGAFPLWLAPVQIKIVPISEKHLDYAEKIKRELSDFRVEIDKDNETMGKKIRNGEMQKIPYLLIVGDEEMKTDTVSVRKRGQGNIGSRKLDDFIKDSLKEIENKK
jgi:threonyl-tRNA synthetase